MLKISFAQYSEEELIFERTIETSLLLHKPTGILVMSGFFWQGEGV